MSLRRKIIDYSRGNNLSNFGDYIGCKKKRRMDYIEIF